MCKRSITRKCELGVKRKKKHVVLLYYQLIVPLIISVGTSVNNLRREIICIIMTDLKRL